MATGAKLVNITNKKLLGFEAEVDLDEGILRSADYYSQSKVAG